MKNQDFAKERSELTREIYQLCLLPNDKFKFETEFVRMFDLVTRLETLENKFIPFCFDDKNSRRSEASFKEFQLFLTQTITDLSDRVAVDSFGSADYGIKAKRDFQKGEEIFRVPNKLILTTESIHGHSDLSAIDSLMRQDLLLSGMPNVSLAFLLLYLKTQTTRSSCQLAFEWSPYLNILPREYHTPLYFSLDEMKLLQASQSFNEIINHMRNVARQYVYLLNLIETKTTTELAAFAAASFSYRNYKWAVSCVSTRQNRVVDEKKQSQLALIPLLDMCNHEEGEFCTDFDDVTASAVCLANRDIRAGEQVTIVYGYRSNVEMLIHNGFVPEQTNTHDRVKLKLGLSTQDPLLAIKVQLLQKHGLESPHSFNLDSSFSDALRVYFFVQVFLEKSEERLNKMASTNSRLADLVEEFEINKSEQVIQYIKTRLNLLLMSYQRSSSSTVVEESSSLNRLFIRRLIQSEQALIKSVIQKL